MLDRAPSVVLPPGVVFDCDGTLADTEALSFQAWTLTLADHGYVMTEGDFAAIIGRPFERIWTYFTDRIGLENPDRVRAELQERYLGLIATDLQVHDDAITTVRKLAEAGVPVAVASSSQRVSVQDILERAKIDDLIEVVIGADDVQHHKPAPEPYLIAAERLEIDPTACVAVEDTSVGVASAVAAGMFTVGVLRAHNGRTQLSAASRVVERITLDSLIADPTVATRA